MNGVAALGNAGAESPDPDADLGYAYVTNKFDFYLIDDPREKALRSAIYRAVARLSSVPMTELSAIEIDEIVATSF